MRDGEVVVRRMGNVSVTFDHRVIDGKRAADFGLAVIAQLEQRSLRAARRPLLRLAEVRLEHRLDLRRGRAALEPRDDALATTSASAGTCCDPEALGDLGALVDVDLASRAAAALLARDVREQALHPPGGPGAAGGEEDEQRTFV